MARIKVLLTDDDPDIIRIFSIFLGDHYDVVTAFDGLRAWSLVQEHRPRVVVTDLNMPGMNGLELTQRIKATPDLSETIVVILTGTTAGSDLPPGFWNIGARADKMLEKPVTPEDLLKEIRRQLVLHARIQPLPPGTGEYKVDA